ncbi:MAG TPA: papain-like cysteine protease family protein [Anaerolineales bacterium]|nr:papain-like cysteine protease family protein [Anaerolineales bacterium]
MTIKIKVKKKKLSHAHWRIIGLIAIAGVLLAGFTQVRGRYSLSRLQQEPLNLPVPAMQQSLGTSCGEAVITMTYNYAYPDTPISEQQVIEYAAVNGYYTPDLFPYTSPANMVKIAQYYAEDVSTGRAISSGQGLSLLIQKLRGGDPIIIDVLSDFRDPESEAHFVVVTGIYVDVSRGNAVVIRYNDPLTGTSEVADWAGSEGVWNAWLTNGDPGGAGWWMVISSP